MPMISPFSDAPSFYEGMTETQINAELIVDWWKYEDPTGLPGDASGGLNEWAHEDDKAWDLVPQSALPEGMSKEDARFIMERAIPAALEAMEAALAEFWPQNREAQ